MAIWKYIIPVIVGVTALSCSDYKDPFEELNAPPELKIKAPHGSLTDSIADTINIEARFELEYTLLDEQVIYPVIYGNTVFSEEITRDKITLIPTAVGQNKLNIIAKDAYGKTSGVFLDITVVENIAPVAKAVLTPVEDNKYRVDASGSYDEDGDIVSYFFDYGSRAFSYTEPIILANRDHIHQNGGITITVTDNKGDRGEPLFIQKTE